jgi:hypothetical protein
MFVISSQEICHFDNATHLGDNQQLPHFIMWDNTSYFKLDARRSRKNRGFGESRLSGGFAAF